MLIIHPLIYLQGLKVCFCHSTLFTWRKKPHNVLYWSLFRFTSSLTEHADQLKKRSDEKKSVLPQCDILRKIIALLSRGHDV